MAAEAPPAAPPRHDLARRYPPLVALAGAVALLILSLPSALRVPQQDPSPVLEYAPVPPSDDEPPNTSSGNLSSLSLGSSSTLEESVSEPPPPGETKKPVSKRCVGKPPRQTEDPMSPPCVPFFEGDNGGATFQGVTEDEIRVLIYLDVGCPNYECSPNEKTYLDLDKPPKPSCPKTWPSDNPDAANCDYIWIRVARALNRYFNERFQTYGRRVHYFAYISHALDPAGRRADAFDNWDRIRPFAVIDYATYFGNNEAYDQAMAARRVVVFGSRTALPNDYFHQQERFAWSFWPDVEHWTQMYASYVCDKVARFPVRRMGNPPGSDPSVGKKRVLGLFYTNDPNESGLRLFARQVKTALKRCGGAWAAEATFPHSGFAVSTEDTGDEQAAAVAKFKSAGVTTILYLGGVEGKFTQMADAQDYYPEIVLAGDLENDGNNGARVQNASVWQNVWAVHLQLRMDRPEATIGAQAYQEGSPGAAAEDGRFANEAYRDHFMLFEGIQVAGPRLTPDSIDRGFHAIPPKRSASPYVASCFFDPGDYTCVKDATEIWWDQTGTSPGDGQPGCWRMVRGGRRALPWHWEGADDVFRNPRDPCTGFDGRYQINP